MLALMALSTQNTDASCLPMPPSTVLSCPADAVKLLSKRPKEADRLFRSEAVEKEIQRILRQITNKRLAWMFENCFPNTLDTTVHYGEEADGTPDTYVYTGDIPAM